MCGICGTCGFRDIDILKRMCSRLAHRGPDDEGYYCDSDVMLGMRRLKVIDLKTGNQPIYNEDKTIVVVYNGEIYNFREIRDELENKGHVFKTNSDTETIVHLYEEYGDNLVNKLRGMFAFALWDVKKKRLLLARDRIGIKPLYYYYRDGTLSFASEIKALLELPVVKKEINFNAMHDYFTFMYIPAPDTIYADIYKLKPGQLLTLEKNNLKIENYWDEEINNKSCEIPGDEHELSDMLFGLMRESVQMHLVSDVPLGVFLSGGTDSSTVVAIMSEVADKQIKTFTIGFEDKTYSEVENARLVADRYHTEHHEYIVKPPSIEEIENILYYFDEPFADSSVIPTFYVSKCAREHVTVALSGDGGDEIFGGYGNYKADKIGLIYRKFPILLKNKLFPFLIDRFIHDRNHYSTGQKIKKIVEMAKLSPEQGHVYWLCCFQEDTKRQLYNCSRLKEHVKYDSFNKYGHYFASKNNNDFINQCIYTDIKTNLPDDYLTKVDRVSMANSLEVRVPLLDHKLVEFSLCMPSRYKLNGFNTKYLLKKIMKDKLPKKIIQGKKKGFSVPLSRWFNKEFSELIRKYLFKDIIQKRGYFNPEFIEQLSAEHLSGRRDNSKQLWTLICFEIWHKRFIG